VEADEGAPVAVEAVTVAEAHRTVAVAEAVEVTAAAAVLAMAHHEGVATAEDTAREDQDTARTSLTSTTASHDHET
jgi:hypothetical protein